VGRAFKPAYVEIKDIAPAKLHEFVSWSLDEASCTDKRLDLKANRILGKAASGSLTVVVWWTAQQEENVIDGMPMLTINKEDATMLGVCAYSRSQTVDPTSATDVALRIKNKIEHFIQEFWKEVQSKQDFAPRLADQV